MAKNLKASEIINELSELVKKEGDLLCVCLTSKYNIKGEYYIQGLSKKEDKIEFILSEMKKQAKAPKNKPKIKLKDKNGKSTNILGETIKALHLAGADKEYVNQYLDEARSGDFDNLITVTARYVDME